MSDMTDEQKAKLQECKTPEEVLELAKAEGYELTDDELEAVSGGGLFRGWDHPSDTPRES